MAKKKNCIICGDRLIKAGRTEHYACRNAKILSNRIFKNGIDKGISGTCKTRRNSGMKLLNKKPGILTIISNIF